MTEALRSNGTKFLIKNDASQFDLNHIFNQLSMFTLNPPDLKGFIQLNQQNNLPLISIPINNKNEQKQNIVQVLSELKGLKNVFRYIKLQHRKQIQNKFQKRQTQNKLNNNQIPLQRYIFIRPTQLQIQGQKTFWMIQGLRQPLKTKLNLDSPLFVITFNTISPVSKQGQNLLVAISRKCITLYQIDESHVNLKYFDTVSIGKRFNCVQMKHIQYKNKNYVLLFGNQKDTKKDYFKCLVYQINNFQLILIKKAVLTENKINSPTILFQNYPKNERQKYCLILGGFNDGKNYFQAWQIDLHLLMSQWLVYPTQLTKQTFFDSKSIILSGKSLKYNGYWYVFCTQTQTINQLKLSYTHGIQIQKIHISTLDLELKEKIYFSQNNLFLVLKGTLKLLMLNKNLEFREKDFLQIVERFQNY